MLVVQRNNYKVVLKVQIREIWILKIAAHPTMSAKYRLTYLRKLNKMEMEVLKRITKILLMVKINN